METQTKPTKEPIAKRDKLAWLLFIFTLAIYLTASVFMFTSCEREKLPDKPITVQVQTQGLIVKPLTKSFSVTDWVFNYNPNQYELLFTGENGNNYSFTKSIEELKTGFAITVLPDTYTVTYQSLHSGGGMNNELSDNLDIAINDIKTIATATPIILEAHNDDYLVIVDINYLTSAMIKNPYSQIFEYELYSQPNETYKYMYSNLEGNLDIKYTFDNPTTGIQTLIKSIPNTAKNNIYHLVSTFNGGTGINILPFDYTVIGW